MRSKGACQSRSRRTNTILFGVHCRKIGASGKRVIARRSPDNATNVARVGSFSSAPPATSSPSDSGLHCGGLVPSRPIDPRSRVWAASVMFLALASTTRRIPSFCACTNARWRPSGEYVGWASRPGSAVIRRVSPVFRSVANRSCWSAIPADHATSPPSGDHASDVAVNGTSATARGLAPTGMIHSLPSASTPIRCPSGESASPMKPRAGSCRPGSGNRAGGSARVGRESDNLAVNGISERWPPDAATFHNRPSAEYKTALPSRNQRIRVRVTSA